MSIYMHLINGKKRMKRIIPANSNALFSIATIYYRVFCEYVFACVRH